MICFLFCSFADDTKISASSGNNIENMIMSLDEDFSYTVNWFKVNRMAVTLGEFQVIFLGVREHPKLMAYI